MLVVSCKLLENVQVFLIRAIAVKPGGFNNKRSIIDSLIIQKRFESLQTKRALTDVFMAVAKTSKSIAAVITVPNFKLV